MKRIYLPDIEEKYDFNDGFKLCCKTLKKRVRQDYDAVLAITGEEGVSKSTCANQMGFKLDKRYSLEKNVLYSPNKKNIEETIRNLPRFAPINGDEAIKILYKLQWHSPLQIFINTFYRLCRQENKISMFCMPRFIDFNEGFRNHRILLWVHLLDRGVGVAFQKDWSPFTSDPWWFKDSQKAITKYRKGRGIGKLSLKDKIKILAKLPNFLDIITFPDLSKEDRLFYKQLATKYKYEGLSEEYEHGVKYTKLKKKYQFAIKQSILLLLEENYMQKDIAKKLGVSEDMISRYKNEALKEN